MGFLTAFCYSNMLKNAVATYQRLVATVFQRQLKRNVKAMTCFEYFRQQALDHARDLAETFGTAVSDAPKSAEMCLS